MYKYIKLSDENIVLSVQQSGREITSDSLIEVADYDENTIGMRYENGVFTEVDTPEIEFSHITVARLKLRMTQQERIDIRADANIDPITFDFMDLLNGETAIDVKNENMIAGLGYLEQKNVIGQGRAAELLSLPILENERP